MNEGELYRLPEVPIEEISVDELEMVNQSLQRCRYRTIAGIEEETGLEPARIASVLTNTEIARKTMYQHEGQSVFASSDHPKSRREKVYEILTILSGGR